MQNADYTNISITTSSESEEEPQNLVRDLFEITTIPISELRKCSYIFGKHQVCIILCNELLTINSVKNFPLQNNRIDVEQLSYGRAIDYVRRLLQFKINFRIKRKKPQKTCLLNEDQKNLLLDVMQQLANNKVKDSAIASILNLSTQRTKFLKRSLKLRQFVNIRFEFENIHESWNIEYVKTSLTYQTINSNDIYIQFLEKFNIASNKLTKTRSISFLKQCNLTYKLVKFRKLRDLSISNKETIAQFFLKLVSCKQKGFKLLYLDETTFSRKDNPYKVLSKVLFNIIYITSTLQSQ